jgi:hypothetical protein
MISLPNGFTTDLPINIIDPRAMTEADANMIAAMAEHPPHTKFKAGDLCYITEATPYQRHSSRLIPRMWQIRFIISAWQHELMRLVHSHNLGTIQGIDHAVALLEQQGFYATKYTRPIMYCHAFPHGIYPDSAAWIHERNLKLIPFRELNQPWTNILDEARAPFMGYDSKGLVAPYTYDLAPDLYKNGENLDRPFSFEEATVHTAALLGLEEIMFRPVDPYYLGPNGDVCVEDRFRDILKK